MVYELKHYNAVILSSEQCVNRNRIKYDIMLSVPLVKIVLRGLIQ